MTSTPFGGAIHHGSTAALDVRPGAALVDMAAVPTGGALRLDGAAPCPTAESKEDALLAVFRILGTLRP